MTTGATAHPADAEQSPPVHHLAAGRVSGQDATSGERFSRWMSAQTRPRAPPWRPILACRGERSTLRSYARDARPATTARYDRRGERAKQRTAGLLIVPYVGR